MRITQLEVDGLFGLFHHVVPLNQTDRVTIVHGANGLGKTTLLGLVEALAKENYTFLWRTPFSRFTVTFDDGHRLVITKHVKHDRPTQGTEWVGHMDLERLLPPDGRSGGQVKISAAYSDLIPREIERHLVGLKYLSRRDRDTVMSLERFAETAWEHQLTGARLTGAKVLEQFRSELPLRFGIDFLDAPAAVPPFHGLLPPVHFISTHRLDTWSSELAQRRTRLMDAGLLRPEHEDALPIPAAIDAAKAGALSINAQDTAEKLAVFDELVVKIELLQRIINERFLYKQLRMDHELGLVVVARDGQPVPLHTLSSGEEHELVLLNRLLFEVEVDALILIDEPEISFHVVWQESFIRDIQEVAKLSRFDVLLATHSPQIISDRWDLTVALQGPRDAAGSKEPLDRQRASHEAPSPEGASVRVRAGRGRRRQAALREAAGAVHGRRRAHP